MSRIVICDVCGVQDAMCRRLRVAGSVYHHKGDLIQETDVRDICDGCLRHVPELFTRLTIEELQRTFRNRSEEEAAQGKGDAAA